MMKRAMLPPVQSLDEVLLEAPLHAQHQEVHYCLGHRILAANIDQRSVAGNPALRKEALTTPDKAQTTPK